MGDPDDEEDNCRFNLAKAQDLMSRNAVMLEETKDTISEYQSR